MLSAPLCFVGGFRLGHISKLCLPFSLRLGGRRSGFCWRRHWTGLLMGSVQTGGPYFCYPAMMHRNLDLSIQMSITLYGQDPYLNTLFYHGFSSVVSAGDSLRGCNQLASSFSLVRTLVVRNTVVLSPSETQTRVCHTLTHHI